MNYPYEIKKIASASNEKNIHNPAQNMLSTIFLKNFAELKSLLLIFYLINTIRSYSLS